MKDLSSVWHYPARFSDARGSEATTIHNDGEELSMIVRGVTLTGRMFDDFEPQGGLSHEVASCFDFQLGTVCGYKLECEIPISLVSGDEVTDTVLKMQLDLGPPGERGAVQWEDLILSLSIGSQNFCSSGRSGFFEDEMLDLQKKLPTGIYIRACISCAFSDYNPAGHGLFGGLTCFRNCKDEYREVKSKADLFRIWDRATGLVQEIYLCPEFERRKPGTGYRG